MLLLHPHSSSVQGVHPTRAGNARAPPAASCFSQAGPGRSVPECLNLVFLCPHIALAGRSVWSCYVCVRGSSTAGPWLWSFPSRCPCSVRRERLGAVGPRGVRDECRLQASPEDVCAGEHSASGSGCRDTRSLGETAPRSLALEQPPREGWAWQRREHLGVERPDGVSLCPRPPHGPGSPSWRLPRGAAVTGVERSRGQDRPCSGPFRWAARTVRLSDCGTLLGLPAALHALTAAPPSKGPACPGGKEGSPGALRGARVQGRGRKTPRPPRRQPPRNGLSTSLTTRGCWRFGLRP